MTGRARLARLAGLAAALCTAAVVGPAAGQAAPSAHAAPAARAALPHPGILVPGQSIAGIRLGMTKTRVAALLGAEHSRCASCAWETWYFQLHPFQPQGLAVEFQRGRVSFLTTLWSPDGWRTQSGITVGSPEAKLDALHAGLVLEECPESSGYDLLVRRESAVTTGYLVVNGSLWGFMLAPPRAPLCR